MSGTKTPSRRTGAGRNYPPTPHKRNYAQIGHKFALEAAKGGPKHCKWVRLAAQRHLRDIERQATKAFPYEFVPWHANDICDFAEKFPHVEGEWETDEIWLEPPQIFILTCVFGW